MSEECIRGMGNHQLRKTFEQLVDSETVAYNDPSLLTAINELDKRGLLNRTIRQYYAR